MKRAHFVLVLFVLCGAAASGVGAAEFKVIANPNVATTEIAASDLKAIFLSTKSALGDGTAVEPVLAKDGPAHDAFLREVVAKTDAALATYYRSLVFTGKASMPHTCQSDADVVAYVAKTKGAVGYVSEASAAPGTKTLVLK